MFRSPPYVVRYILCAMYIVASTFICAGCAHDPIQISRPITSFIVMGPEGANVARAFTYDVRCPSISIDGTLMQMDQRAAAETIPLRTTRSSAADSKASAFPLLTCEKRIPTIAQHVSIEGEELALPKAEIQRIVVIGDTGCRLKKSDNAYQACNDAEQYPFARIASLAAAWKPDLVLHVGDYHYRENKCPDNNIGCKDSSWGYGWDTWRDDFFTPAKPLLKAAPWVVVRGNHESCARAGQGWWRFLDPRPLTEKSSCNLAENDEIGDYSDAYAVALGRQAQIIVLDTSNTLGSAVPHGDIREEKYRAMYRQMEVLSQNANFNFAVNHHPILGFSAILDKSGAINLLPGNVGMQSVFQSLNPLLFPPKIQTLISGHTHVWEEVSFSSPHPSQLIAGFSGTLEDTVPLPSQLALNAAPAPNAVVEHFSSWVNGFGFMTLEREGELRWRVGVWNLQGEQVNTCLIDGKHSECELKQVP